MMQKTKCKLGNLNTQINCCDLLFPRLYVYAKSFKSTKIQQLLVTTKRSFLGRNNFSEERNIRIKDPKGSSKKKSPRRKQY